MRRLALGSFEDRDDGSWVCFKGTVVDGPAGRVSIARGQTFKPGTVFAGYDDFAAYLASVSVPAGSDRH